MLKHYVKQTWQLLKQNKLFSTVYIVGTGLAIAMTMTLVIIYYIKIAPVYPEVNRNRVLSVKTTALKFLKRDNTSSNRLSYSLVKDKFYTLETPQAVTAIFEKWGDDPLIELNNGKSILPVKPAYVDHHFWQVFEFEFLSGKPFEEADFLSGIRTAVISASLSNKLFGTKEAEGKRFIFNGGEYKVSGVVRDASFVTPVSFAQLWVPYSVDEKALEVNENWGKGILGPFSVYMLGHSASDRNAMKAEVEEIIRKINASQDEYVVDLMGQPEEHWKSVFRFYSNQRPDWTELIKTFSIMLLALLLIPAVNLAGMISSRMEKRLPEIGIRKSFGASRGTLFHQLLIENLILTTLGGVFGLILSYLIMYWGRNWLLVLFDGFPDAVPEGVDVFFTMDMLFNPVVFLITFVICFVLNLLSAIIPACLALKKDTIYSLNSKK